MALVQYAITITGKQPLLMHADDIEWSDQMDKWRLDLGLEPSSEKSKAGDDRSPAWRWLGNLYHDRTRIAMPLANIMKSLMEGGSMVLVPGGKGNKTFKAQTQSGILYDEPYWPLTSSGKEVLVKDLMKLNKQKDFDIHKKVAEDHGFRLLVKRAKIGTRKHVRVRPEFQNWMIRGTLTITDEQITKKVLQEFF